MGTIACVAGRRALALSSSLASSAAPVSAEGGRSGTRMQGRGFRAHLLWATILGPVLALTGQAHAAHGQTLPVTFPAPVSVPLSLDCPIYCPATEAAAVGDFNGDGNLDVISITTDNEINISFGNGDGTFQQPVSIPVAQFAYFSIAVGDFNGDGKQDIALWSITNSGTQLVIYLGDGKGGFTYSGAYQAPNSNNFYPSPADLVVADLSGHGKLDVIGLTQYNGLYVFPGNGDGTFGTAVNYNAGYATYPGQAITVGDLNGDGKQDLAVSINNGMSVLLNNGDGTFGAATYYASANTNGSAEPGIAIADLTGTGKPDVIAGNSYGVYEYINKGHGTFTASLTPSITQGYQTLSVGDINGDGIADLVVENSQGQVFTYPGTGKGGFKAGPGYPLGLNNYSPIALTLADFNHDGVLDLFGASVDNWAAVMLGRGDGTFQAGAFGQWGEVGSGRNLVSADFNGDGIADLAYGFIGSNSGTQDEDFAVTLGIGHGVFGAPIFVKAGPCIANKANIIATGDVNGDKKPDVVATLIGNSGAGCLTNMVAVVAGKGNGKFDAPKYYATGASASAQENGIYLADLNGDGKPDIVTENSDGTISVLINKGGSYKTGKLITSLAALYPGDLDLAIGDFNGDGKLDIAATTYGNQNVVYLLPGNGDGTFGPPIQSAMPYAPYSVAAGDFNGDGKLDLLVTTGTVGNCPRYTDGYAELPGNGDGTFSQGTPICGGYHAYPKTPVVADLNGDGKLDVVIPYSLENGNTNPDGPTLLQGNGDGTFVSSTMPLYVGPISADAAVADFNGDGRPGIAVLNNNNIGQGNNDYATFITILNSNALALDISPLNAGFGSVKSGAKAVQTVILTNDQASLISISGLKIGGADPGDFTEVNNCGTTLKPGLTCTATVTFQPTASGTRNATLLLSDGLGKQMVTLTGIGE